MLALPLLWACFDGEMEACMPADMRNRIRAAYETIRLLEPEENPVKKILLGVSGHDAEVHIDEITDMDVNDNNLNGVQGGAANMKEANFKTLYAQNTALQRDLQEVRAELQHHEGRARERESELRHTQQFYSSDRNPAGTPSNERK